MNKTDFLPIVVGITGHRAIRPEDDAALRESVRAELMKLKDRCPNSPLMMLCSLAEGADLLCADVGAELGIPLIAAFPREREDYSTDFSDEALQRFSLHCDRAELFFTVPFTEAPPEDGPDRDFRFRQAGIYIAAHSHVLLALWDGGPGTEAACGTAETVDFALHGSYKPASGLPIRGESNEAVIHVFTPRGEHTGEAAGTVRWLGDTDAVQDLLQKTDDFNHSLYKLRHEPDPWLPEDASEDPILKRMESVGTSASNVSVYYARRYRMVLALMAAFCGLLTFAFLLYDEAQAIGLILACGVLLVAAWLCRRYAVRTDSHRRSLEFRVLSESLRVQCSLRYAGSFTEAASLFTWTQREETAWILDALCALSIGGPPKIKHDILSCWAEDQREYHRKAGVRSQGSLTLSERTVRIALTVSVLLYLAGLLYELLCGGLFFKPLFHPTDIELGRTILKIGMGTLSAVTLFTADYYGKLSLSRAFSDHQKMERFYAEMAVRLKRFGQTEELLTALAREELTENAGWFSYQQDNKPDINL